MLLFPSASFRKRRARAQRTPPAPAPPAALTLVSAGFNPATGFLRLSFNRPIDVSGMFPGNLVVEDAVGGARWEGVNPTVVGPATVDVEMSQIAAQAYPDTRLDAMEPTGIVATDDPGEEWAGVTDLLLPFS